MSVVVCQSPALASFHFENEGVGSMVASANIPSSDWRAPARQRDTGGSSPVVKSAESRPGQFDIWSMIQSQKASAAPPPEPYVPPLLRRSSGLMSQKSLEMCTENLGSESGYDDFSSLSDDLGYSSSLSSETEEEDQEEEEAVQEVTVRGRGAGFGRERAAGNGRKELSSVNYHCSVSRRSPHRSFPPPLPSLTRRDGPCLHMRSHRRDGRLVVEAVPAPSQNYLHARRQDGRLLLSFIDTTFHQPDNVETPPQPPEAEHVEEEASTEAAPTPSGQVEERQTEEMVGYEEEEEDGDGEVEEEEEEEEEVEVVDRGTVVEVKVSTQPQQQSGAMRVRSSLVINKFVGGMPLPNNQNRWPMYPPPPPPGPPLAEQEDRDGSHAEPTAPPRRPAPTTTTAAAAAAVASSMSAASEAVGYQPPPPDNKLLFTSNRRNREEMLHHMRRCSQLRQPLFFWETCCIATSS